MDIQLPNSQRNFSLLNLIGALPRDCLEQRQPSFKNLEEHALGTIIGSHSLCLPKYNQIDNNLMTTPVSTGPSAVYSYASYSFLRPPPRPASINLMPTLCQTLGWGLGGQQ